MSEIENKFADWLDGKVSDAALDQDDELRSMMEFSKRVQHEAEMSPQLEVPNWDRGATFDRPKQSWWRWEGLPALSFGTSMLAIVMVIAKVEINIGEDAMTISFAGKQQQAQMEQLVNDRLKQFEQDQSSMLAQYVADVKDEQQQQSTQLVQYLVDNTRKERREDFVELMKFLDDQRKDDQFAMERRINQIQSSSQSSIPGYSLDNPLNIDANDDIKE